MTQKELNQIEEIAKVLDKGRIETALNMFFKMCPIVRSKLTNMDNFIIYMPYILNAALVIRVNTEYVTMFLKLHGDRINAYSELTDEDYNEIQKRGENNIFPNNEELTQRLNNSGFIRKAILNNNMN